MRSGVAGIARDLAAAGIGRLIERPVEAIPGAFPAPVKVALDFGDTPALCIAFGLRLVRGVTNGPSPEWLQKRLRAVGLRPINALVDVTNFLTFDRNRPLHVFDAARVAGDLIVRRAKPGETLLALDGRTYTLDDTMCVIADDTGVESIAGIMGGEASGCTEATTDVLMEAALWEPINIAQTGRKLGIHSDARYRNERGIDPAFNLPGLDLATQMILDLCGGTPSEVFLAGEIPMERQVIDFPVAEVRRLAGIDPATADVIAILDRLGYECRSDRAHGHIAATVPSWRPDVTIKADLVEEVIRIIGVDRIPATPLPRPAGVVKPVLTLIQTRTRRARRALAARGLVEAVTWSFIARPAAEAFGGGDPALALANPIAAEMSDMRPSLLPGLIAAAQRNADRGFADLALFEVGAGLSRRPAGGPVHRRRWHSTRDGGRRRRRAALVGEGGASLGVRRQGRRARPSRRARPVAGKGAGDRRRAGMVPPRKIRHHPPGTEDGHRRLRRVPSGGAGEA